jgi:heavy metal efflux system protein
VAIYVYSNNQFMLGKIISFSIRNKLIIGLFVLALIVWGVFETTRLPIDAVPDITDNQVQVITVSPSLGAPDVERLISFPIEQACSSVPGIKQVRSFSRFGLSLVTIVFDEGTDVYWARQQISERLQMVARDLPAGIGSPELAPVSTGLGEIYQYVVRPLQGFENKYDVTELRTIQDWIVRRHLLGTPGVAEVSSFGGKLKQYEIAVMPDKLKAHGISIGDIFGALEQNNENTGGAYIEKGPTVLYIRSEGLTRSLEDIRKIVVKTMEDGTPLLMSDVAEVSYGAAIRYGAMTYNDKGEVAGAVVMMLKGANASTVTKAVKEKIALIQKMLPEGVVIEPFLDRTKMVDNAISTVETNLIEGALIVIFVLVFMLGNLRAGLIVSSVIPLAMLFAIILMNKFGVGGNLMSLGAIDFGLIVDGSVIVIEAILHRFMHSKHFRSVLKVSQDQMDTEVATSTGQMIKSAIFSQVIILIVYLPILSLQGIEGKMFKPMAYTIAFAILGAFILSVTYVPMMAALFLSKKPDHKPKLADKMLMRFSRVYRPMLSKVMHYPVALITATLSLFVVSVVILMNMGGEFMPQLEEGDFAVETRLLTGSNLNTTVKLTQQAAHILLTRFPEVQKVVTKIGSAEIPTDPMPMEAGDMMVILKDKKQWTSATSFDELSQKMTKELEEVPGLSVGFQFPVQMRFNELMTGARQDIVCKIFGEDLDSLTRYAHTLNEIIGTVQGARNIYEEKVTGMPQVVIRYNRDAMAKYGMNVAAINRTVNTAFAGQVAGQVYEGERRFDMVVRLAGDARKNVSDIQNLLVSTNSGVQIPLSAVATIDVTEGVNQIQREQTRRRIIVGFNVGGRDVKSIVDELQQKVNKQLKMPKTYSIVYGGSFENMTAATERLSIVVPIALFLIFLLLYFAFNSVKQGLLIYTAIPLSAIGGILALWIRDMPFSISAGVGFIALFGVAVLNGILLVTEFNRLKAEGWTDVKRIVIHATKSKLRAVLMTALVPSLGFIPMAISTGAGGEVQKPLATVVIGGLIVSTLLTLFVLPILYILFEKGFKYLRMSKPVMATILLVVLAYLPGMANEKITLTAAIDSALHSNNSLRVASGEVAYFSALRNAGFDIDKTGIQYQYGKFNSLANDNSIAVTQAIQFPTVYKHQRDINQLNILLSESGEAKGKIEIRAAVKHVFYSMLVMQEKVSLLRAADSLYGSFLAKSKLRFDVGDIDVLELTTLENQQLQIAAQLLEIQGDYEVLKHRLRYLTNTQELYEPQLDEMVYNGLVVPDNFTPDQTPSLIHQAQRAKISQVERKLETSKLLPSLSVGFNSMTIMGWQPTGVGTERYFGSGDRFSSVTFGIGVPVFYGAQRSRIRAANRLYEVRMMELDAAKVQLMAELDQTTIRYRQQRQTLQVFQQKMLPNAEKIISTANLQLSAGAVGYINWTILINQSFQIRNEYLNTVQKMNDAAFEIEKIISTN